MSAPRRTRPSGSVTRPERLNMRMDVPTWARTQKLFARWRDATGRTEFADIWEYHILPELEKLATKLPPPRPRDLAGQMTFGF